MRPDAAQYNARRRIGCAGTPTTEKCLLGGLLAVLHEAFFALHDAKRHYEADNYRSKSFPLLRRSVLNMRQQRIAYAGLFKGKSHLNNFGSNRPLVHCAVRASEASAAATQLHMNNQATQTISGKVS